MLLSIKLRVITTPLRYSFAPRTVVFVWMLGTPAGDCRAVILFYAFVLLGVCFNGFAPRPSLCSLPLSVVGKSNGIGFKFIHLSPVVVTVFGHDFLMNMTIHKVVILTLVCKYFIRYL